MKPIGMIRTPFTEKFGVPRQAGMIPSARGLIILNEDARYFEAVRGLDKFSHIWVLFLFAGAEKNEDWKSLTTVPRLDVESRVGVFASRSPHHPNHIGMSPLKLESVDVSNPKKIRIHVAGVDILDQTTIIDIKPYIPFVDRIQEATSGFTDSEIPRYSVKFSKEVVQQFLAFGLDQNLVTEMLELDPRPTAQKRSFAMEDLKSEGMSFAFRIGDFDVKWQIQNLGVLVTEVLPIILE